MPLRVLCSIGREVRAQSLRWVQHERVAVILPLWASIVALKGSHPHSQRFEVAGILKH